MAKAVRKEKGRLDVLIKNAGVTDKWESITDRDAETYFKTWDLHVKGTYLMSSRICVSYDLNEQRSKTEVVTINTIQNYHHFKVRY